MHLFSARAQTIDLARYLQKHKQLSGFSTDRGVA